MRNLYIKTYGCQMNVYDSEFMTNLIKPMGFKMVTELEQADVLILNTCHIREKAVERLYSELGHIHLVSKKKQNTMNKKMIIIIAGCVAQAEGEEIFNRAPFVDIIVGPQSIADLPNLILAIESDKKQIVHTEFPEIAKFDNISESYSDHHTGVSACITIQEGCNKFCTFCVVPYTRGNEYSRPVNSILREVLQLVHRGAQEITLLGQNINAYHGINEGIVCDLGTLITHIAKIEQIRRIRYITSHPKDMHETLYYAHAHETKLMPFLHLPVQSGSNKILRRMNRQYTVQDYLTIIHRLRTLRYDMAFSSDFIVGYPGETEQDFQDTIQLVQTVQYTQGYSFIYSPRPGTPAAEQKDQVSIQVQKARLLRLQKLLNEQQMLFNRSMIGKIVPVLFTDKRGKYQNQIIGKSVHMQSVCIYDEAGRYNNTIVNVKILQAFQNSLLGEILEQ
ncbi:tRNA (N6-isopentenyl adenosine(37)-C2)-methylthiotransferase MiaB [Wolbachia endosymbiont of Howardula sp.]|uniref:tRNA (N6-isopentenyl adenosine(37)-C2)-methylthiotransferase MiaB n=1 Tax=Wolbachia endosymbiont of Howardula sp. TaxID=2916816 RepID=UPI00217E8F34|nr:tRNA (N6-isopentenyl adenosine(37)-C2)-methylthiotransferase MiaB [Wolbachia endosymbiont of Howardula sp.]UWI83056.1 tRNA (N6-isopentenyl adenosine(37)-C2)-methylthiotransferase MiaB [Wolbachia endosymbiont of Howardula sp.]